MANYIGYIYSITNEVNGKSYIGKTNDLVRRWKEHCYHNGGTSILEKAFAKYGLEHFVFDIIAQIPFDNVEELNEVLRQLEIYYIALYDTYNNGYNATIGGDGTSYFHHSEETKRKISERNKGRVLSEEHKAKCRIAFKGRHHTEEAKKAIRIALSKRTEEVKRKTADKLRGKKRDRQMIMRGAIKRRKPILQYDMQGNFIKEFEGATFTGFEEANIIASCKNKISSAYGYLWRYKTSDIYPLQIEVPDSYHVSNRSIIQYNKEGEIIAEYKSATAASKITTIGRSSINNCLCGRSNSAGNYLWKYKIMGGV